MALEITEDVLRALINLNAKGDHDYIVFKEWIRKEHDRHIRLAAFSIGQNSEFVKVLQGMATICNDLSYFLDFPKEHLEKMETSHRNKQNSSKSVIP